ncbi:hypothetical protein [Bremerella sp. P1]|uniref:hypothetical protein n=1 Tax=Bremerella sp. P1 TaxID=3026424 RepID=UPI002367DEDC|nr:hypothetical protein [Bremerella sp. P1]WDI42384.1 hypothetical protein PSR63_00300 [Bremerella sp. P1]
MDKPRQKWQLSLRVILILVGVIAIAFAIWIPREKPPQRFTLDTLLISPDIRNRVIVGDSITGEFQIVGFLKVSTLHPDDSLNPEKSTLVYDQQRYEPADLNLPPGHVYLLYLVVERGEESPQWVAVELD